jgi:DNA-binding LacI/PurR family transcriptional regulator
VVNGGAGVRPELRERVERAVEELGYLPNQAARTLVTRRNDAIAVVIAEPEARVFSDPFFARQLRGISKELAAADCQLVLLLVEDRGDFDRVGRYLAGGHVDGAVMFSLHGEDPLPGVTAKIGLPTVFGGRPGWLGSNDPEVLYVDCDNRGGGRLATQRLIDRGCRTIATITGPLDQTSAQDRWDGWRDALFDAADPDLAVEGDFTAEGGSRAMTELLARRPDLDGVFAASDLMASGALRVLADQGRRVPQDVAVVGFDNVEAAGWTDPPLTTVHQDIEGMGRIMARLLLRRLAAERAGTPATGALASVITSTRLVIRASA